MSRSPRALRSPTATSWQNSARWANRGKIATCSPKPRLLGDNPQQFRQRLRAARERDGYQQCQGSQSARSAPANWRSS